MRAWAGATRAAKHWTRSGSWDTRRRHSQRYLSSLELAKDIGSNHKTRRIALGTSCPEGSSGFSRRADSYNYSAHRRVRLGLGIIYTARNNIITLRAQSRMQTSD